MRSSEHTSGDTAQMGALCLGLLQIQSMGLKHEGGGMKLEGDEGRSPQACQHRHRGAKRMSPGRINGIDAQTTVKGASVETYFSLSCI